MIADSLVPKRQRQSSTSARRKASGRRICPDLLGARGQASNVGIQIISWPIKRKPNAPRICADLPMMTFYDILSKLYPLLYTIVAILFLMPLIQSWRRASALVVPVSTLVIAITLFLLPHLVFCIERSAAPDVSSIVFNVYCALSIATLLLCFLPIFRRHFRSLLCIGFRDLELLGLVGELAKSRSLPPGRVAVRSIAGASLIFAASGPLPQKQEAQELLRLLRPALHNSHGRFPRLAATACVIHAFCILLSAMLTWGFAVGRL